MKPFDVAFHHATPHGVMSAIHIPDSPDPVPEEVLARLPAEEAAHARTLKGYRQPSFVGGRLALRRACEQLGHQVPPILPDARGTPVLPGTLSGSVSHKRDLAIGMVGSSVHGTLGVDLEDYGPARLGIADSVLRPEELSAIAPLPDARRWIAILVRFSLKESVYKALDPHVRRYVGFHEAFVEPDLQGGARIALHLANAEGPFTAEGRYDWLHGRLVTSVRLRRA
ncbi:MAG: 4'-phosphopantetheinyl transferase superfamily protein [Alphaproteobacteria bacterium]|nr:4'-phosphopantetheinyl transferase superfamily protein [Alphaproteobacteria bacterium]MCB9696538.1 4'-phosphopantetheinyl transferase superfamily protein [Alphaproteobacteria bacterium]